MEGVTPVDHTIESVCKDIDRINHIIHLWIHRQLIQTLLPRTPTVEDTVLDGVRAEGNSVTGVDDATELALPDLVEGGVIGVGGADCGHAGTIKTETADLWHESKCSYISYRQMDI